MPNKSGLQLITKVPQKNKQPPNKINHDKIPLNVKNKSQLTYPQIQL